MTSQINCAMSFEKGVLFKYCYMYVLSEPFHFIEGAVILDITEYDTMNSSHVCMNEGSLVQP